MIGTIAVIAAIAEKKMFSDRSDNDRWTFFFLSDRRDRSEYMETRL